MISWTLSPTSVRTPRQAENCHKQIAIAKAVLQGMFMKLIKCSNEAHMVSCPWFRLPEGAVESLMMLIVMMWNCPQSLCWMKLPGSHSVPAVTFRA